ncbi:MAG TPA: hypothetical protein DIW47_10290 [Bacteroidetes bacterium]|nr:hypothetical protein [Bacteroidota bacterium]
MDEQPEYNIEQIVDTLRKELLDTALVENFEIMIEHKIRYLSYANCDNSLLFPNQEVDSAVYMGGYALNELNSNDFRLESRKPGFATILCKEKIDAMIHFMNDPANFFYGECGTQIPEAHILFFSQGKQVARVVFACGHSQISYEPETPMTNFGGLSDIGGNKLDQIKPWK